MKKTIKIVATLLLVGFISKAETKAHEAHGNYSYDGSAYIFVESGIEFSVFPDGQFDFIYLGHDGNGNININIDYDTVNLNYNSGYNYDMYIQYDDYGAVIQVENIEIYYDAYGRIVQAGNTEIIYYDRRIVRVGGLRVFYNHYGYFSHCTGFINFWTPRYIYHPWHSYYVRPFYSNCIVYDSPYRTYYRPYRYSYNQHRSYYINRHREVYTNGRRSFYRPGSRVHYQNGIVSNRIDFDTSRDNTYAEASPRKTYSSRVNSVQNNRQKPNLASRNIRSNNGSWNNNARANSTTLRAKDTQIKEANHTQRTIKPSSSLRPKSIRKSTAQKAVQTSLSTTKTQSRDLSPSRGFTTPQTNMRNSINNNTSRQKMSKKSSNPIPVVNRSNPTSSTVVSKSRKGRG